MAPAARTPDSVWTRLGRALADSPPALWLSESVLHNPRIAKSRGMANQGWARVLDICYPLIVLVRGVRHGAKQLGAWSKAALTYKRRVQAAAVLPCQNAPFTKKCGPLLLILGFIGGAAWL